jgi:hypothetical protein
MFKKMAPPLPPLQMKLQKYFLFYCNHDDYTLIALGDVVSSNNVARFDNIYSAFDNQQPKIDVPIINLIYFLGTKSSPLGFLQNYLELMHLFCFLLLMC